MEIDKIELFPETRDLIERLPDKYNSIFVLFLVGFISLLVLAGILVKTPDTVRSEVKISNSLPPIVLNAKSDGKLNLLVDSLPCQVQKGQYIAFVENSVSPLAVKAIASFIDDFSPLTDYENPFPVITSPIGELASDYYSLIMATHQYADVMSSKNNFSYQTETAKKEIDNNKKDITYYEQLLQSDLKLLEISYNQYVVDSSLYSHGAILKEVVDNSMSKYLSAREQVFADQNRIKECKHNIGVAESALDNISYQRDKDKVSIRDNLLNAYTNLRAHIKVWENQYVFISDVTGTVEFANIVEEKSFVMSGEPIFTVIQDKNKFYGIAIVPSIGAGTIKIGQNVNIKLAPYPFEEYGMLLGKVKDISLNAVQDGGYLVYIDLPSGLVSTNKTEFVFADTMYGIAEIITEKKCLFSKMFRQIHKILAGNVQTI